MTRYIQRHSFLTRFTHGVVAITCIALAITGVFVFWPELGGSVMGGDFTHTMRMLHRVVAVPFILVPILAALISPKGCLHMFRDDIFGKWDSDDVTWAMKFPFYLFMPSKVHMPPQHHVKSAQRLADGALVFFCIILGVTGVMLWLKTGMFGMTVDFDADTLLWARLLHDIFFVLTTIVGIAHIYLGAGIFEPYKGTARIMFGDGKVSESDALYHWGYWANEELTTGRNVTLEKDQK